MLLTIAGASSKVALSLLDSLSAEGIEGLGFHRSESPELVSSARAWKRQGAQLTLVRWDAAANDCGPSALAHLDGALERHDELVFVYACGQWWSGDVAAITAESLARLTQVHFTAPALLLSEIAGRLRAGKLRRIKVIVLTGLTGANGGAAFHSLYGATVSALQQFVRSLAAELAGSVHCAFCIELGLMDKGQPYIEDLCATLVTKRPTPLLEVARFLRFCVTSPCNSFNGSVLSMSAGLNDYQGVHRFLEQRKGALQ
ncbi:MAG TPA: SDR family oxidoreductase [Polyangiaceae bacterium]|jgi:NAD(P)-dependent dehydrogenase (short-subunit alcohol dehydrogenase family)|nr:SDR family oxidoreductase [Polyangiaceae bacterium]